MNKIYIITLFSIYTLFFYGCNAASDVGEDAKKTPIGSVFTGETQTADSYIKKVSDQNRSNDTDTWRPMSNERL